MQTLESVAKAINSINPRARYFYLYQDYDKTRPLYIAFFSERADDYRFDTMFDDEDEDLMGKDYIRSHIGWQFRYYKDFVGRIDIPSDFDLSSYPVSKGIYDFSNAECIVDDGNRSEEELETTRFINNLNALKAATGIFTEKWIIDNFGGKTTSNEQ